MLQRIAGADAASTPPQLLVLRRAGAFLRIGAARPRFDNYVLTVTALRNGGARIKVRKRILVQILTSSQM